MSQFSVGEDGDLLLIKLAQHIFSFHKERNTRHSVVGIDSQPQNSSQIEVQLAYFHISILAIVCLFCFGSNKWCKHQSNTFIQ